MENKDKVLKALQEVLTKVWDDGQKEPNQYVVAYKRVDNDELIGYHLSTFCQITKDILEGKRYSGESPYPQLKIIANNVKNILACQLEPKLEGWKAISQITKKAHFAEFGVGDVYLDAVYLTEGTPTQSCRLNIIDINSDNNE